MSLIEEIAEIDNLLTQAKYPGVIQSLNAYKSVVNRKITEESKKPSNESVPENKSTESVAPAVITPPKPIPTVVSGSIPVVGSYIPIQSFSWDQGEYSSPLITIYVDIDNVGSIAKENVECKFTADSFDLKVHGLSSKNYRYNSVL